MNKYSLIFGVVGDGNVHVGLFIQQAHISITQVVSEINLCTLHCQSGEVEAGVVVSKCCDI